MLLSGGIIQNAHFVNSQQERKEMAKEAKNCCDRWPKFWPAFRWMTFEIDGEVMAAMPHIQNQNEPERWRVNYCPSCGAEVRDVQIKNETLADALF